MVVLAQQLAHSFIRIMPVSWMPVSFLAVHILLLFALISFYVFPNLYFELDSLTLPSPSLNGMLFTSTNKLSATSSGMKVVSKNYVFSSNNGLINIL